MRGATQTPGINGRPWTPYEAPPPPPGSYDPALDAQQRAAERGYGYLKNDTATGLERAGEDFNTGWAGLQQGYDRGIADLGTQDTRSIEDYTRDSGWRQQDYSTGVQRRADDFGLDNRYAGEDFQLGNTRDTQDYTRSTGRLGEDHGIATGNLARNFQRLGAAQVGQAAQAGVSGGGTLAAAFKARQENQGLEQSALDLSKNRGMEDIQTGFDRSMFDRNTGFTRGNETRTIDFERQNTDARTTFDREHDLSTTGLKRYLSDSGTQRTRMGEDLKTGQDQMRTTFDRYDADQRTALRRAQDENMVQLPLDIGQQKVFAAQQAGYTAPAPGMPGGRPKNEFTDPNGNAYRIVVRGDRRYRVDPSGKETLVGMRPKGR